MAVVSAGKDYLTTQHYVQLLQHFKTPHGTEFISFTLSCVSGCISNSVAHKRQDTQVSSFSYRRSHMVQNSASKEKRDDNWDSNEEVEPSADVPDSDNTPVYAMINHITAGNYLELIILLMMVFFRH